MAEQDVEDFIAFLAASPTPFHAVVSARSRLEAAGFRALAEADAWDRLAPGRYFVTTSETNLFAFVLPGERARFRIVGAHTDSPNLRLKPSAEYTSEGYTQLGVEVYGGALLNSWLDRDLGIAGRVIVRHEHGDGFYSHLVRFDKPLARVPQLAIHLDREVNEKGLVLDRQNHLAPVWGLAGAQGLHALIAETLHVAADRIASGDLMLYDVAPPAIGGAGGEFLFSARLDNLAMCHAAVTALCATKDPGSIAVIALFDHEEVGSNSAAGAGSSTLPRLLERLVVGSAGSREAFHQACERSTCV